MRLATLTAGKAEVVVSRFPQGSGTFVMNVNRWRKQVGLPDVQAADPSMGTAVKVGAEQGRLYDFVGDEATKPRLRQMVAIVNKSGMDWFFKIIGPAEVVESERGRFTEFLNSVRLGE